MRSLRTLFSPKRGAVLAKGGAVLAAAALILSACVALPEDEATGETLFLGAIAPLSGDGAAYGLPLQRVAELAAADVNAKGGVNGRRLAFLWEDGGCNPDMANRAAQKLVAADKMNLILGGFCSSETLSAAKVTEPAKVVLFSTGSSSPDVSAAGDFVFRNYPSDSSQGKLLAAHADAKGYKKVGILAEQSDYALGIQKVFEAGFTGETLTETYIPDASDFRTQILKLKGAEVDAYFLDPQTPGKADLMLKQLQEQGVIAPLLVNDVVMGHQETVTKYAEYMEGAVGAEATYDRDSATMLDVQSRYKVNHGEDLPYLSYMATTYDAVWVLKEALEADGVMVEQESGINTEALRDYLYGIKGREGLSGTLTMDENGDPLSGHVLRTVKGGMVEDL